MKSIILNSIIVSGFAIMANSQAPDTLWTKAYGDWGHQCLYSVVETPKHDYAAVGDYNLQLIGDPNIWLVLFDDAGDTLSTRQYGGTEVELGYAIDNYDMNNGFIITGYTESYGIGGDIYLLRIDSYGDTIWTTTLGGPYEDCGCSVKQTTDGGFIVVGYTKSFGAGGEDIYIVKTNSVGQLMWSRTFGGAYNERGYSVQPTADGGYIIGGTNRSITPGNLDYYLIKLDQSGNCQ